MFTLNLLFKIQYFCNVVYKRNIGLTSSVFKDEEPIRQLFIDKLREYKSKSSDKIFVDPTPEIEQQLKGELQRLAEIYGADKEDFSKFPTFNWKDPVLQPINMEDSHKKKDDKK